MPASHLIVCEKSPHWAIAFRGALRDRPPQIVETRGLPSTTAALGEAPASLIILEITDTNLVAALEWIDKAGRQFPLARVLAALTPDESGVAPLLREAGAIEVLFSTQQAASVARLARRQFALAPPEQLTPRQWIAQRMPWSAYAAAQG
jgi:hypothetical protein